MASLTPHCTSFGFAGDQLNGQTYFVISSDFHTMQKKGPVSWLLQVHLRSNGNSHTFTRWKDRDQLTGFCQPLLTGACLGQTRGQICSSAEAGTAAAAARLAAARKGFPQPRPAHCLHKAVSAHSTQCTQCMHTLDTVHTLHAHGQPVITVMLSAVWLQTEFQLLEASLNI